MPTRETLRVTGLREFIRAADASGKATKRAVRDRLRKVGEIVAVEARRRISGKYAPSATYRSYVRRTGYVTVEQPRRKTTGSHPEWGAYQMRHALLPALRDSKDEFEREMESAIDDIAEVFDAV